MAGERELESELLENARATVFTNGPILTLDEEGSRPDALLVVGSRIAAVGTEALCLERAARISVGPPRMFDLMGRALLPGFVDPHAHPLMHGQTQRWIDCGPEVAGSIPEIVRVLSEAAAGLPPGVPVRGYGYQLGSLEERRHPTRYELDRVSTTREVYLMIASGHGGVVNSITLENRGVTRETEDPIGGRFFRDEAGDPTGVLFDAACDILTGVDGVKIGRHGPNFHLGEDPAALLEELMTAQDDFVRSGVTTLGDMQVTRRELGTYLDAAERQRLKIRYSMYFLSHLLEEILELGIRSPFGDEKLAFGGVKCYADGTLGGGTAFFPEGYPGDPCHTGQLYHQPHEFAEIVRRGHRAGLQIATHAQSPTAIQMVLEAVSAAQQEFPRPDPRHRIEHCGLPETDQIARLAERQIFSVLQTQHYYGWGEGIVEALGEIGERYNPLGDFARANAPFALSSDAPVAPPRPLLAIQVAVNRRTLRGNVLGGSELCIDVDRALRAHTIDAARSLKREGEIGSLEAGKLADLVLLSDDPSRVPHDRISSIEVVETWVGGVAVFPGSES